MLFEQLRLNVTKQAYIFTPLFEPAKGCSGSNAQPAESLTIYRESGRMELNAPAIQDAPKQQELVVYGIMGFIQLHAGLYLIAITGRERTGTLKHHELYRATTFQILSLASDLKGLTSDQVQDEQTYIHLLQDHLRQNTFYFSYTYDLTRSMQRQRQEGSEGPLWKQADNRFFWNRYLVEKMTCADEDLSAFILPVIQGFINISSVVINNRHLSFGLISRRSRERAGTRYFSRGLDTNGHASNFVESEQVVICDHPHTSGQIDLSFVQTRGSLPAIWGQIANTRYTPQLWADTGLENDKVLSASKSHFDEQVRIYGPLVLVNLVNKKGYEYPMGRLYEHIIEKLADPRLYYAHFDFHHECRNMRWNRVQLLIDKLEPQLVKQGYYCHDPQDASLAKLQTSIVRSNCMDCLDRTNVVQSALAKWMLNRQLRDVGVLQSTEVLENDDQFMAVFNSTWADNADVLSIAYSGTGALKTDYTRTGKRTYLGAYSDLVNSLIRYIKNNYMDGSRQDGIDLFLGTYTVEAGPYNTSPFKKTSPLSVRLIPAFFVMSLFAFFIILFCSDLIGIESSMTYIITLSFSFTLAVWCWHYIQLNGTQFVDWPRLKPVFAPRLPSSTEEAAGSLPTARLPLGEYLGDQIRLSSMKQSRVMNYPL
ncbi:SacI homology domain-containing protein [Dichotomocladium elegans]|nr:SacI homology domain-containing protein [Dichotomocladium elegans]